MSKLRETRGRTKGDRHITLCVALDQESIDIFNKKKDELKLSVPSYLEKLLEENKDFSTQKDIPLKRFNLRVNKKTVIEINRIKKTGISFSKYLRELLKKQ